MTQLLTLAISLGFVLFFASVSQARLGVVWKDGKFINKQQGAQ